jgi:hypothetical protein
VATANLDSRSGSQVRGTVTFTQVGADIVRVSGEISGHSSGPKGFHVHEKGDCSDAQAMSAGGHFNPRGHKHGGPYEPERHAGRGRRERGLPFGCPGDPSSRRGRRERESNHRGRQPRRRRSACGPVTPLLMHRHLNLLGKG